MQKYNYLFYDNVTVSNDLPSRRVYCFIVDLQYVSTNVTCIHFTTDSWMTYGHLWSLDTSSQSYIERGHVLKSEDIIGKHIIPEGLETGPYIISAIPDETNFKGDTSTITLPSGQSKTDWVKTPYMIVMFLTDTSPLEENVTTQIEVPKGRFYGGVFSGMTAIGFSDLESAYWFILQCNEIGKIEAIQTIYMLPYNFANWQGVQCTLKYLGVGGGTGAELRPIKFYFITSESFILADTLVANVNNHKKFKYRGSTSYSNAYTPINNKLFSHPYSYLMLSDNNGGTNTYKYEYFSNPTNCQFKVRATVSQGGSALATPVNYLGRTDNYNESLDMAKFPSCSWPTDSYTTWLAQTSVSRANQRNYIEQSRSIQKVSDANSMLTGLVSTVGSIVSGDVGGALAGVGGMIQSGTNSAQHAVDYQKAIADMNAQEYEHSLVPTSAKNSGATPEVNFAIGNYEFYLNAMSITGEYAKQIDDYFSRYGYKLNKSGNVISFMRTRSKWNYVKLVECNQKSDQVPNANMEDINNLFLGGVTLWRNVDEMFRYDLASQNI